MFDVRVLNTNGVWITDTVTSSKHRAQDRARFLLPRVPAAEVRHQADWARVDL